MGRAVTLAGWAVCLVASAVYGWRVFDAAGDPSIRAYSPLLAVEGLLFVSVGGAVIALGWWLEKNASQGEAAEARNRTLLVWLFRGQALVSLAVGMLAGLWLAMSPADSPSPDEAADSLPMLAILAASALVFTGLPWWIGRRLKRGMGTVPAALYSVVSLFAFPVGTILGGIQLLLLHAISRRPRAAGGTP